MFCMFSSVLVGHLCRIFCRFLAQFSGPVWGHVVCVIIDCMGFFFFLTSHEERDRKRGCEKARLVYSWAGLSFLLSEDYQRRR